MNTTEESMRKYFEYYGEVTDCSLMLDRETGKSRGFGFVTFKDPASVEQVLSDRNHVLDGKTVDCKEAIPKSADPNDPSKLPGNYKTRKIFVGGLPHELSEGGFAEYFAKYGTIVHSQIMKDRESGKPRGFGFITFESEDSVEKVLENIKEHKLMGKWVECKKATPSTKPLPAASPPKARAPPKVPPYPMQNFMYPKVEHSNYYANPAAPTYPYNGADGNTHLIEGSIGYPYGEYYPQYYGRAEKLYNPYSREYPQLGRYPSVLEEYKVPLYERTGFEQTRFTSLYGGYSEKELKVTPDPVSSVSTIDYAKSFSQPTAYSGFYTEPHSTDPMTRNLDAKPQTETNNGKIDDENNGFINGFMFSIPTNDNIGEANEEEEEEEENGFDPISIFKELKGIDFALGRLEEFKQY